MTNIGIRAADLEADRDLLVATLCRCLTPRSDEHRFEWLYKNNPHGCARVWIAFDVDNGTTVGVAGAFPRRIYIHVDGREELAWVLGDFCVNSRYRSLGPALQLQRACLGVTESNGGMFCYDFPSANMIAVYKRLGFAITGKMQRLAMPLRVDRKVKEMIKNTSAQRVVSSIGNALLKRASPIGVVDESLEVAVHAQFCGEEFTVLAQEQRGKFGLCLDRSAEYLNWRYVNNPLARHEIVTARRDGRLVGHIVWTQAGEDVSIVDLFGEDDPRMMRRLIAEVKAFAQERGVMTLSVSMNEAHPWRSLFSEMGFRLRDSAPVMIIPSRAFAHKIDPQLTGWYLMQGDRDS